MAFKRVADNWGLSSADFETVLLISWWLFQTPSVLGEMSPVAVKIRLDAVPALGTLKLRK